VEELLNQTVVGPIVKASLEESKMFKETLTLFKGYLATLKKILYLGANSLFSIWAMAEVRVETEAGVSERLE